MKVVVSNFQGDWRGSTSDVPGFAWHLGSRVWPEGEVRKVEVVPSKPKFVFVTFVAI